MNQHQNKNTNSLRFAFFGTPLLAKETLEILHTHGYTPSIIITAPDARSGRGMHLTPTPVKVWAYEHGIPCLCPTKITSEFIDDFKSREIELSIVVAYGKILPADLISIPNYGTLNIHYSILPQYRGASPLEQALLNGDKKTGVTIQQMAFKLDSGALLDQYEVEIPYDETKDSLRSRLTIYGAEHLVALLPHIPSAILNPVPQDESHATYCTKIKKENGLLDINGNALENYNKYRAFFGWPGVYFFTKKNGADIRVKITKARYENNSFIIERVIPEGRKEVSYSEFLSSTISK